MSTDKIDGDVIELAAHLSNWYISWETNVSEVKFLENAANNERLPQDLKKMLEMPKTRLVCSPILKKANMSTKIRSAKNVRFRWNASTS